MGRQALTLLLAARRMQVLAVAVMAAVTLVVLRVFLLLVNVLANKSFQALNVLVAVVRCNLPQCLRQVEKAKQRQRVCGKKEGRKG